MLKTGEVKEDHYNPPSGYSGFFVTTAGCDDNGKDGVMWEFYLRIPDNAQPGDVYPIDIHIINNDHASALFYNKTCDEIGELMNE